MKKLTCLPAGKILPIATLISLIFFAGSVNAQNYEVCKEKMQSIQDKCDKSFEECNNPCKSLTGTAWSSCYTACSRTSYDCYQKSVSPYNECLEKENTCEEAGKIMGSKDCEKVQDRNKNGNPFSIFAFNPLEIWRNIQGFLDIEEGFPSLLQSSQFLTESAEVPVVIPRPSIAFDPEGKPWDFLPGYIPHESIYLGETMRISEGTNVSAGGVNQGSDKKLLNLEEGEVEVIKNEQEMTDSEYDGIRTPNGTVLSIQTHYWVSYDKKKNQTTVVVYEGKVEVKTKDGETYVVSPNGDKPGVVLVSQKLSPIKLAIGGLILAVVIGGAVLILKRKFTPKRSNRKKK